MNTAYRSQSAICRLDHLVDAEWLNSPNATLRLLFAAPGFGQLRTVDVAEPWASALWRRIQPGGPDPEEPVDEPAPEPARKPTVEPIRDKPHNVWGNGNSNGQSHTQPDPGPAPRGGWQSGGRPGNGGQPGLTRYPRSAAPSPSSGGGVGVGELGPPTRASQLFPWAKKQSERGQVDLVGYLEQWGQQAGFRGKFRDWSDREVGLAVKEAGLFLQDQGVNP